MKKALFSNTVFPKDLIPSLWRSRAKGFRIPGGSPTKNVLSPKSEQPFNLASQESLKHAWQGFDFNKRVNLLFEPILQKMDSTENYTKNSLRDLLKDLKGVITDWL